MLLSPDMLTPVDPPLARVGGSLLFKAVGPNDLVSAASPIEVPLAGRALRPLSPVRLRAARQPSGDIVVDWVRRSRQGFDWLDGADAPLAEEREGYLLTLSAGGATRVAACNTSVFLYTAAQQLLDTGPPVTTLSVSVAQTSATGGRGSSPAQFLRSRNGREGTNKGIQHFSGLQWAARSSLGWSASV